jgi:hypothetical protein
MLATTCIDRNVSYTGATHLPVVAVVADGHGRRPLKAQLAPLAVTFDSFLGIVSGNVGRGLLVVAWDRLPASLHWAKHDCLIIGGALGGDVAQLLERALEGVTTSTLSWALCVALG